MPSYNLKNADAEEFDLLLLDTGLGVEAVDDDGNACVVPLPYDVFVDRIGPITLGGVYYPEYYTNLYVIPPLTPEQEALLKPYIVYPAQPQYRVWLEA